jgi:hypothetical protein
MGPSVTDLLINLLSKETMIVPTQQLRGERRKDEEWPQDTQLANGCLLSLPLTSHCSSPKPLVRQGRVFGLRPLHPDPAHSGGPSPWSSGGKCW